jgi:DNA processing protein
MNFAHPHQSSLAAPFSEQDKLDWLQLTRTDNVGPITFYRLLENFGSASAALAALPSLSKRGGKVKPLTAPSRDSVMREYEELQKRGGDIICAGENDYPLPLAATEDAPPVLSYIGDRKMFRRASLAIVGARNASLNGRKFTETLARELGASGQVITSGLARGIDTAAHTGALDTGTIAVVAGGIDIIYPPENEKLYRQIGELGLVVAESPLGMEPLARHFPRRNRIVSGLSAGVIVIEATLNSGSLITARLAAEQGRDVYAIPGHPLDPRAEGPNRLIRDGATLVTRAQDIIQNLGAFTGRSFDEKPQFPWIPAAPATEEIPPEEARDLILSTLSLTPLAVDELVRTCQLTIPVVQTILLELELAGRLQRLPGNRVVLLQ